MNLSEYMAAGINNILNIFNPDAIILNSSFTIYLPDIIGLLEKSLKNRMDKFCTLLPSGLQDTAILLGGASVVLKNFFGITSFASVPGALSGIFMNVTIHGPSVREQHDRGFIENSLREWNPLTPESFSYAQTASVCGCCE